MSCFDKNLLSMLFFSSTGPEITSTLQNGQFLSKRKNTAINTYISNLVILKRLLFYSLGVKFARPYKRIM